jgi:hypothetical protein
MPIPNFDENGLLPEGIHDCTWAELAERFCRFQSTDRRPELCRRLQQMVEALRSAKMAREIIIDGSFVTNKPQPNDIDLILVLPADWDLAAELTPDAYNLISKNRVRKRFGFDIFIAREQSLEYETDVDFLQQVRDRPGAHKGLLRIRP